MKMWAIKKGKRYVNYINSGYTRNICMARLFTARATADVYCMEDEVVVPVTVTVEEIKK